MSTTTTNLGLIKPEKTDPADITKLNQNWDKIDALKPENIGALSASGFISDITGAISNIDTLQDGIYHYNGWASQKLTCSAGLPFVEAIGIWIKKTYNNSNDNTNRTDVVINNNNGKVYVMKNYDGTWKQAYLSINGGTLTGANLGLNNGYGMVSAYDSNTFITSNPSTDDNLNRRILFLCNKKYGDGAVERALILRDYIDGSYVDYKLYGEHNKPTASDVGLDVETITSSFIRGIESGFTIGGSRIRKQGNIISGYIIVSGDFKATTTPIDIFSINLDYTPAGYATANILFTDANGPLRGNPTAIMTSGCMYTSDIASKQAIITFTYICG